MDLFQNYNSESLAIAAIVATIGKGIVIRNVFSAQKGKNYYNTSVH